MKQLLTTSFFIAISLTLAACSGEAPDETGSEAPLVIDDELLRDTFDQCEIDIDSCLQIEAIADEIERRVADGEWVWHSSDEELEASAFRYRSTGCVPPAKRYYFGRLACSSIRFGRLIGAPRLRRVCRGGTRSYLAPCWVP